MENESIFFLWVKSTYSFLIIFQMIRDQGNITESLHLLFSILEMGSNYTCSKKEAALIKPPYSIAYTL